MLRRLCKAGVLPARFEPGLSKWSAYAELVGYVGSVTAKVLGLQALDKHIASFEEAMSQVSVVRFATRLWQNAAAPLGRARAVCTVSLRRQANAACPLPGSSITCRRCVASLPAHCRRADPTEPTLRIVFAERRRQRARRESGLK